MKRVDILRALETPVGNARYELRRINMSNNTSVFDRKADAFIPLGAIPHIDPAEAYEAPE